jgi:hypothetical protein
MNQTQPRSFAPYVGNARGTCGFLTWMYLEIRDHNWMYEP